MSTELSAAEARRVFLGAQSMARRRPRGAVRAPQFRAYLERQGVLQLDSVNVLARAHYLPLYSRFGAYDRQALDAYLWGSGEAVEQWGHVASVMPRDLLGAMHPRMVGGTTWKARTREGLERRNPGLLEQVLQRVEADGPVTAADLEHLHPPEGPRGSWWDGTRVKVALEYAFITGLVACERAGNFVRTYDSTARVWGVPPATDAGDWALDAHDATAVLAERALRACGVATAADVADHFRMGVAPTAAALDAAVERGDATAVRVDGWKGRAYLARGATDPGSATGAALLSPFDPVCWFRPRLERMFGVEYRIGIYTPAQQRTRGYYALPFLLGDQIVALVDLKADRQASRLLVQGAWSEERTAPGARRKSAGAVAEALATELEVMRGWLGLDSVEVTPLGDVAEALARR